MSLFDRLRRDSLALPGVVEEHPWGETAFKVGVGSKMFLVASQRGGGLSLTFKPDDDEREGALLLPFVAVASYVGRYGWLSARPSRVSELAIVWPFVLQSYASRQRATRRTRKRAGPLAPRRVRE